MKLLDKCKYCNLPAIEKESKKISETSIVIRLECGHTIVRTIKHSDYDIKSIDNKTLKPFQQAGIRFIEDSGFRCLIGDEMGLGKTVQYLGALKLHEDKLPALYAVKAGLVRQLEKEIYRWTGCPLIGVIESSKPNKVFPFPHTIVAYDTLARMSSETLDKFSFVKTLVIDECQHIKNSDTKRTNAVRMLVIKNKIEHILAVSGTPIKNRVEEFFPILNLLAPKKFPSLQIMLNKYFEYGTDIYGNVNPNMKPTDNWEEALKPLFIRRTREDVAPELPKVNRMFFNSEIENKELKKSYAQVQLEFETFYKDAVLNGTDSGQAFSASLLGFFARMRKITGAAKLQPVRDFVVDFLLSTNRKLVIFGHHKETLSTLKQILDTWCADGGWNPCQVLKSEMNADQRDESVRIFRDDPNTRIMIASTLASGEGLNLQFCSDAIMMERQWNPANEEQAETRFTRFGSTANKVNVTYMISIGTIDDWLTELVEDKRELIGSVVDGKEANWNESSLMSELANLLATKGAKKWSY